MSAASPKTWSELTLCPSCGAAVDGDAKSCWLCNWDLAEEIVTAEVVGGPPKYLDQTASKGALIAGIIILGIVTVGVFAAAPGIGVLLGFLFVFATFAVAKSLKSGGPVAATSSAIEQAYASPHANLHVTSTTRQGSVLLTVLMVIGMIGVIGAAAIIALVTFCVIIITAGSR